MFRQIMKAKETKQPGGMQGVESKQRGGSQSVGDGGETTADG